MAKAPKTQSKKTSTKKQPTPEAIGISDLTPETSGLHSSIQRKSTTAKKTASPKLPITNTNTEAEIKNKSAKSQTDNSKKAAPRKITPAKTIKQEPSIDEVAEYINTLKVSRRRATVLDDENDEENNSTNDLDQTLKIQSPERLIPTEKARTSKNTAALVSTKRSNKSKSDNASGKNAPLLQTSTQKDAVSKNEPVDKQIKRIDSNSLDREFNDEFIEDRVGETTTNNDSEKSISRREQRRLQWLEKRRLWREQKYLERQQRRTSGNAESSESHSNEPIPDDENISDQPLVSTSSKKQQPVTQAQPKSSTEKNNSKKDVAKAKNSSIPVVSTSEKSTPNVQDKQSQEGRTSTKKHQTGTPVQTTGRKGSTDEQPIPASRVIEPRVEPRVDPTTKYTKSQKRQKTQHDNVHDIKVENTVAAQNLPIEKPVIKQSPTKNAPLSAKSATKQKDNIEVSSDRQQKLTKNIKAEIVTPSPIAPEVKPPSRKFTVPAYFLTAPTLSESANNTINKIETYLLEELVVEDGASIVVAVSGGVDSVVLLDALAIISYKRGYTLVVAHVNHNLRGTEAKRDERFVRSLSEKYHTPCHTTSVSVEDFSKKHRLSIEEAARELRYKFFRQIVSTVRAQYCAMAHTADDTAETLLMNLFRGSGLTGLSSIPPRRMLIKKTQLVRPLLQLSKDEIYLYANERQLEWVEDSSNSIQKFTRNKIRQDLLPKIKEEYNPKIIESLRKTATLLRKADGFIDSLIHSTYQDIVNEYDSKTTIDVGKISVLHEFLQGEIIERAVATLTYGKPVSFASVERIQKLLTKDSGTRETIKNNLVALKDRNVVSLYYDNHEQAVSLTVYKLGAYSVGDYHLTLEEVHRNDVRIGLDPNVEYVDYDKLPYRLLLRTWQAGDSFHPIGLAGHSGVSDFLTNIKVDHENRSSVVVLTTATDILWVCGLRLSDDFKISNDTRRIIKISYERRSPVE